LVAKELIDARWKAIIGMALAAMLTIATTFTFDLLRSAITPAQLDSASKASGVDIASRLSNFEVYAWGQTFSVASNTGVVLVIVAALLGASVIAGEVSKGTIFLLLSRPVGRERILLTKYLVGAAVLFCMNALTGVILALAALIAGHPQSIGGIAASSLLFWLGTLFVLGVSTLFSVVFSDVLRPLALTVVVLVLLSLPGLLPHGGDWVLPGYWSSLPVFLGQEFPTKALLISLVAALVPALAAVPLFRRQQY
jgi:ABC-type transport system involved in multi-copper enzyme maturation permease subunit